jgi:D-glycero-alpha-D-manno-heptose 1-phosphate guanylyltransferase
MSNYPQQAIILAGGFGTRLRSVVSDVPKPMAAINGKPFLCYVLDYCAAYAINEVILAVGYKHDLIEQYFGNQYKGMRIVYSIEQEALGTGGAIKQAMSYCTPHSAVYVLNGDTFFATNLQQLYDVFEKKAADIALALCHLANFDRYGVVETEQDGQITAFCEKQFRESGNINGGVYVLKSDLLQDFPQKFSFEKEVLEMGLSKFRLYAQISDAYFIDIGIPDDYKRAMVELA